MNRGLVILGVFVSVVLIGIGGILLDNSNSKNVAQCVGDEDCVKVQVGYCKCNMGGEDKCVPKSEEKSYLDNLKNCSANNICAAVYNCEIESCSCVEGRCV